MANREIKVADECWVALALLSKEHPERVSFSTNELLTKIRKEHAHSELRAGVNTHIHQHNVANRPPSTARYRMFYRLPDSTLRLYRPGDSPHPERRGKTHPVRAELPPKYHSLLDWYEKEYCHGQSAALAEEDPILSLRGLGKEVWAGVDADTYVNDLRSGWDGAEPLHSSLLSSGVRPVRDSDAIWRRVVRYQGAEFKTVTQRPFTYRVDGNSGIWFIRQGHVIDRRLWRGELEEALKKCPLTKTADLQKFQCSSYLFGLLTDPRILGSQDTGAPNG